ncbi:MULTISPECIES: NHL repeat-containing protein [unclassified Mycolicibacterium]|uniref:NHL repeat-containing protein n=1 Tax=unclassified Mycolicibacterium TaxID=2636767 RepID=UPI0013909275|nr:MULTISPECIES: NHL repeat-containing protein [unclassified Mycolicibacterium]
MATLPRRQRLRTVALISSTFAAAIVAACTTSTTGTGPTTSTLGTAATTAPAATAPARDCEVNTESAPIPSAETLEPVPPIGRISVALKGFRTGTITPGEPPADVEVRLCNDSAVDYPQVGVVVVLERCSCATSPNGIPAGTIERFDPATNAWIALEHPSITTGMDYLALFTNVQALPKGADVTLKYRIALDKSMTAGKGGVQAVAVTPQPLVQLGRADLPFTVIKDRASALPMPTQSSRQSVLPFSGLTYPGSVAADSAGNVYVSDTHGHRVVKLAAGSTDQTVLGFNGVQSPGGIAVDSDGNVYVADFPNNRVVRLDTATNEQTVVPFTGLDNPRNLAVDKAGTVYVTDVGRRVLKLTAENQQSVLPFTDLTWPGAVAVDGAGDVFVADPSADRVVKLASGTNEQSTLSVGGLDNALAVNEAGDVYFTDAPNKRVVKVAAGTTEETEVPLVGLNSPTDVTVDHAGNVYVIDNSGFGQVVRLAAG